MAAPINAYFIKKIPYCENYRTVAVDTAHIPIPRIIFLAVSLALLPNFYPY